MCIVIFAECYVRIEDLHCKSKRTQQPRFEPFVRVEIDTIWFSRENGTERTKKKVEKLTKNEPSKFETHPLTSDSHAMALEVKFEK